MKPVVSVIIPFLNEEENIPLLVLTLNSFFKEQSLFDTEVIFVNDGSTDNSVKVLKECNCEFYKARIISLSQNYGSHAALRAGITSATGDYISFMYADLQDPVELISQLFSKCDEGYNIAWAVRNYTSNSWGEKFFSRFYSMMMKKYAIAAYPEKGFDIVMFDKKVQQNLNLNIEANSSIFLQILTLGFKQITIGYDKQSRKRGKSKWTISKKIKLFIDSFIAFSFAPIRFVTIMGFVFFVLGIIWTAYVVIREIVVGDVVVGWPTLISILFLGFGLTNISLGIIAEYLWRTLDASRKRPVFIIDEIFEMKNNDK